MYTYLLSPNVVSSGSETGLQFQARPEAEKLRRRAVLREQWILFGCLGVTMSSWGNDMRVYVVVTLAHIIL